MTNSPIKQGFVQPRLGWWQLSLRTALLAMTLACLSLGYFMNRVHSQRVAVKGIIDDGGRVAYRYENGKRYCSFPYPLYTSMPAVTPFEKMLAALPVDYYCRVSAVNYGGRNLTKEPLKFADSINVKHLRGLYNDFSLNLISDSITDETLKQLSTQLSTLPRLGEITISSDMVTDKGLEHLRGNVSIKRLHLLNCSQISNNAKKQLINSLPKLEKVSFATESIEFITPEKALSLLNATEKERE